MGELAFLITQYTCTRAELFDSTLSTCPLPPAPSDGQLVIGQIVHCISRAQALSEYHEGRDQAACGEISKNSLPGS